MAMFNEVPGDGLTLTVGEVESLRQVFDELVTSELVLRGLVLGVDEVTAGHVLTKKLTVIRSRLLNCFVSRDGSTVSRSEFFVERLAELKAGRSLDGGRVFSVPELTAAHLSSFFISLDYSYKVDFGKSPRSKGFVPRLVSEFHEEFSRKRLSVEDRKRVDEWKAAVFVVCGSMHELSVDTHAAVIDGLMVRYREMFARG